MAAITGGSVSKGSGPPWTNSNCDGTNLPLETNDTSASNFGHNATPKGVSNVGKTMVGIRKEKRRNGRNSCAQASFFAVLFGVASILFIMLRPSTVLKIFEIRGLLNAIVAVTVKRGCEEESQREVVRGGKRNLAKGRPRGEVPHIGVVRCGAAAQSDYRCPP